MDNKKNRNRKARLPAGKISSKLQVIPEAFDIPGSAISGLAQIEMSGNREAVVGGCGGVLEYDENVIKLSAGKMIIKFCGRNLQIKILTHDCAVVSGFITTMEFMTN